MVSGSRIGTPVRCLVSLISSANSVGRSIERVSAGAAASSASATSIGVIGGAR
jgi:hypothetical protein